MAMKDKSAVSVLMTMEQTEGQRERDGVDLCPSLALSIFSPTFCPCLIYFSLPSASFGHPLLSIQIFFSWPLSYLPVFAATSATVLSPFFFHSAAYVFLHFTSLPHPTAPRALTVTTTMEFDQAGLEVISPGDRTVYCDRATFLVEQHAITAAGAQILLAMRYVDDGMQYGDSKRLFYHDANAT